MADVLYDDDDLDEWDDEVATAPAPAAPAPDFTENLNRLVERMAAMNASQLDRLSAVLTAISNRPMPAPTIEVEAPKPRPCSLKINRDKKGLIDSIEVEPK